MKARALLLNISWLAVSDKSMKSVLAYGRVDAPRRPSGLPLRTRKSN
jgi:hypothetical protein